MCRTSSFFPSSAPPIMLSRALVLKLSPCSAQTNTSSGPTSCVHHAHSQPIVLHPSLLKPQHCNWLCTFVAKIFSFSSLSLSSSSFFSSGFRYLSDLILKIRREKKKSTSGILTEDKCVFASRFWLSQALWGSVICLLETLWKPADRWLNVFRRGQSPRSRPL